MKKLLVSILSINTMLVAEIDVLDLKNTYNCLRFTDNAMLSPFVGALSLKSGWMKNFYRSGDDGFSSVRLVKNLFYYNEHMNEFVVTRSSNSVVQLLATLHLIDPLIAWYIRQFKQSESLPSKEDLDESKKILKSDLLAEALPRVSFYAEILQHDEINRAKSEARSVRTISEDDAYKRIEGTLNKINNQLLNKIEAAYRELHEKNSPLPAFLLDQILATYWFLGQPGPDGLSTYMHLLSVDCKEVFPQRYSAEEQALSMSEGFQVEEFLDKNPELIALYLMKESWGMNPPYVGYGHCGRIGGHQGVPDCVESCVRNFLDFILFDEESHAYNFNLLPTAIQKNISYKLQKFYDTYPIEKTLTEEARFAWFELVASLQNVGVRFEKYDGKQEGARSSEENIWTIINGLLGIQVSSLNELALSLSTSGRILTWDDTARTFRLGRRGLTLFINPSREKEHCDVMLFSDEEKNVDMVFDLLKVDVVPFSMLMLALSSQFIATGTYQFDYFLAQGSKVSLVERFCEISKVATYKNKDIKHYCSWLHQMLNSTRDMGQKEACYGCIMRYYDDAPACIRKMISNMSTYGLMDIVARYDGSGGFIDELIKKQSLVDMYVLERAVKYGSLNFLKKVLDHNLVNVPEGDLVFLLVSAVNDNQPEVVRLLTSKFPSILNLADRFGARALFQAVEKGNRAMAALLLDLGAFVNQQDRNQGTPLYRAVLLHDVEMVKLLVDRGADASLGDILLEVTPLDVARDDNLTEILALLEGQLLGRKRLRLGEGRVMPEEPLSRSRKLVE